MQFSNPNLSINKNIFSLGGVIGRLTYLTRSIALLMGAILLSMGLAYFLAVLGVDRKTVADVVPLLLGIPATFFFLANTYKRVRDIRGTDSSNLVYNIISTVLLSTPIGPLFFLGLLLWPGKITGGQLPAEEEPSSEEEDSFKKAV